jgi:hypothetical protein
MDLLAWLLLPTLAFVTFFIVIIPEMRGRRLRVAGLGFGLPFLVFFGDELAGRGFVHALCATEGGYQYNELLKADGYLDVDETEGCGLGCLEALTRWGYSYYETEVRSARYHAASKGFYKYYLVESDSERCAGGKAIPRERGPYGILPPGRCVAYDLVSAPTSRYEVSMIRTTDLVTTPFKLQKVFSYVKDRERSTVVASATSYRYWGGWVRNNSFGHNGATACPEYKDSHGAIQNLILTSTAK